MPRENLAPARSLARDHHTISLHPAPQNHITNERFVSEEQNDNLVNVQIDGKWMKFPKGTRMIEACRQADVEVPHYCYHPKLTSPGNR